MTYDDVIAHWGGYKEAAEALEVAPTTVETWRLRGAIPGAMQYKIQVKSRGRLRADGEEKRATV